MLMDSVGKNAMFSGITEGLAWKGLLEAPNLCPQIPVHVSAKPGVSSAHPVEF